MLDLFITSRVRRKIVILFSKYPDYKSHVRGIAKLIREDAGNIQRELSKLEDAGFLNAKKVKNTKVYSVNKAFGLYKELQALVLKSRAQEKREN